MIRKRWPDNSPRIIAITAYALEGDMDRGLDAGMDDYTRKPIQLDELRGKIVRCLLVISCGIPVPRSTLSCLMLVYRSNFLKSLPVNTDESFHSH